LFVEPLAEAARNKGTENKATRYQQTTAEKEK